MNVKIAQYVNDDVTRISSESNFRLIEELSATNLARPLTVAPRKSSVHAMAGNGVFAGNRMPPAEPGRHYSLVPIVHLPDDSLVCWLSIRNQCYTSLTGLKLQVSKSAYF